MDFIIGLLNDITGTQGYSTEIIYLIAAIAGLSLAIAINFLISSYNSPRRKRMETLMNAHGGLDNEFEDSLEHGLMKSDESRLISRLALASNDVKTSLMHAGFHSTRALAAYNALRILIMLLAFMGVFTFLRYMPDLSTTVTVYVVFAILGLAFITPGLILDKLASSRMTMLRRDFPDALDLLVVCCEAGMGLIAALQRVSGEIRISHFTLAKELELVCKKIQAGLRLEVALSEFAERTGLEDIRGLNGAITQSMRLGTGIAETLRIYAEEYRDKRRQAAEEKAAKLGVKMLFPTIFCIWPAFFIVAVGPSILKIARVWGSVF